MLLLPTHSWGRAHFCRALHVAMQIGPYHPATLTAGLAYGLWGFREPILGPGLSC